MPEIRFAFFCYDCEQITEAIQKISEVRKAGGGKQSKKMQVTKYCEYCKRANIIETPDEWYPGSLVLGKDKNKIAGFGAIPMTQGKKP